MFKYDILDVKCGIGLVVECDLPKVETGVRFSYPAQRKALADFGACGIGESNGEGVGKREFPVEENSERNRER